MLQTELSGKAGHRRLRDGLPPATISTCASGVNAVSEAKKIDPYDVEALEKSLNDSATRVSTIWVSFLLFSLYLLVAAATITHRQLFLAEPVKLPVLNIELPLVGFFFLTPILYVVFHAYVLIQVILLARTATAYNEAVDENLKVSADNSRVRQRLANTLFAQIFAGSPHERTGWLGWLLKWMAWATLAIAPILILLAFQFAFLPYHSDLATWTHRLMILFDLIAIFTVRPTLLEGRQHITWSDILNLKTIIILLPTLLFSTLIVTFPGERQSGWTRLPVNADDGSPALTECTSNSLLTLTYFSNFDRLYLPSVDVVDDEKLAKLETATDIKEQPPYKGERIHNLTGRDLSCGTFRGADLRRIDFTNAILRGSDFSEAELQGATLQGSDSLEASFSFSHLEGANLSGGSFESADFSGARLQAVNLSYTSLQGANFFLAELQTADLYLANLQGARLVDVQFEGASLVSADLRGSSLNFSKLHGANLDGAQLQGTNLTGALLAGVSFDNTKKPLITLADFSRSYFWRAPATFCEDAQVTSPRFDAVATVNLDPGGNEHEIVGTKENIDKFIEESLRRVPKARASALHEKLHDVLLNPVDDSIVRAAQGSWQSCAEKAAPPAAYEEKLVDYLVDLVCDPEVSGNRMVAGFYREWRGSSGEESPRLTAFARALTGRDSQSCPIRFQWPNDLTEKLQKLR